MLQKLIIWLVALLSSYSSFSQPLDKNEKRAILDNTISMLSKHYHFRENVKKIEERLNKNWKSGAYSNLNERDVFTTAVAKDMKESANDQHLNFFYTPAHLVPKNNEGPGMNWGLIEEKFLNNGLNSVSIISGDIGLIKLQAFGSIEDVLPAAFTFVANTQALIIDLRGNGGGMPSNLVSSYLLPEERIHLLTMFWNDRTDSFFTEKNLKGPRYLDRPVYLLTDKGTFSSAEEFAYDLQALKRVTIVGEATGGGANPGGLMPIHNFADGSKIDMYVSMGHVENAITKTNWEGKGVQPEVKVNPSEALKKAHLLALDQLISKEKNKVVRDQYELIKKKVDETTVKN